MTRVDSSAEYLRNEYGYMFREITGDDIRHNHTAAKIRWLVDNYPDSIARVRTWLFPKDFLRYKLTGLISTEVSDAIGTLLYDPIASAGMKTTKATGTISNICINW
jgi:xylulokinase